MRDLWSFLLQTLTASGAAVLLLAVKAIFRDKLSPRWQFAVWGVLGAVLLLPAGVGGRYVLFNWPFAVETVRSLFTGEYGVLTRVAAPVPLTRPAVPETAAEWLYVLYLAGVAALLLWYLWAYVRLRLALRRAAPADGAPVRAAAEKYGLPLCPAVEVEGLSTAFVCGVFRPVLALPAGAPADEKVLLHELLHLRHRDAAWGLVICLFRCIHWCNPLLWYCADRAGNDLESLCDQRVLERLEGEDRRDYGRILLGMANERYARMPGTSSMANGGRQIRRRIEAIVRFRQYPQGMALASVCVALVLAAPLLAGTRAQAVRQEEGIGAVPAAMASARTTFCTTCAGALDAYAKAVLDGTLLYRAMCAPLAEQDALAEQLRQSRDRSAWPGWDTGLPRPARRQSGYQIYNLRPAGSEAFEGLVVVELTEPPEGQSWSANGWCWLAFRPVRAEREGARWVVRPLGDFRTAEAEGCASLPDRCDRLPALLYEAEAEDFTIRQTLQTTCAIDSFETSFSSRQFRTVPQPGGTFTACRYSTELTAVYTGSPDRRGSLRSIGVSCAPMALDGVRPALRSPGSGDGRGGRSAGEDWGVKSTFRWDMHGNEIPLGGSGGGFGGEDAGFYDPPERYAADLYVNGERAAELTLLPREGGAA